MYHSTINFSDKLHNSRLSKPAITCNNTLNIDEPEGPKIDNGTAHYQNVVQSESKVHYEFGIWDSWRFHLWDVSDISHKDINMLYEILLK